MTDGSRKFKFIGRSEPDLVVGERVVVFAPLPQPASLGPHNNLSVHGFVKHAERFFLELMRKYGHDCDNFELTMSSDGKVGVVFTRPMDRVELTHFREATKRNPQANGEGDEKLLPPADLTLEKPRLPDPTAVTHIGRLGGARFAPTPA